jgi:acetylornithine/succinyldiaminopimelate/putrescine aminotransferase
MNTNFEFFEKHLAQTTQMPIGLEIERAEGIWLYATDGTKYMDLISGVGVSNYGHGHPKIKTAVHAQVDKHMHVMVYGEFHQAAQSKLAEELASILPESLDTYYFVNSGTEANEAALKLAKRVTNRSEIISFRGAYHGSTHGSLSVSGNEVKKRAFRPLLPDVHFLEFNNEDGLQKISSKTACVIMETVQGDAGIRIPNMSFMAALRARCTETGALLIFDEIQAGLGRTGKLNAFEHFGIEPDLLTLGKALGGGMPIGALAAPKELMEQFTTNPMLGHITTFGGHPVVCASAAAGIQILKEEIDLNFICENGNFIANELRKHPRVKAVRQIGYFFAIDLGSPDEVQQLVDNGLKNEFIGFWFLSCPNSFRIAPPLNMTVEETTLALKKLKHCLDLIN